MADARTHAATASELLENIDKTGERLRQLSPEDHLQMVASGEFTRINADLKWTVDLALAHAIAAIALVCTDLEDDVGGPSRAPPSLSSGSTALASPTKASGRG